jgi:hypothetical protein
MSSVKFDVAKYKLTIPDPSYTGDGKPPRTPLTSFELREINGEDEIAALDRAREKMPSGRLPGPEDVAEENISEAFVSVNGSPVIAPWGGHRKWPAKVRDFLRVAFRSLNDADQEDIQDFAKAVRGKKADGPSSHG